MQRYLLKRLLLMLPTLFGVAVLIFVLMRVVPGDVVVLRYAGEGAFVPRETIEAERIRLGLNKPIYAQFLDWMAGIVRLDFGLSMWTGQPVATEIGLRFQLSLELAILSTIIATLLAIPLGTLAAVKRNTPLDYVVRTFSIAGLAVPTFWLGILIILALLVYFRYLPPVTFTPLWKDPVANLSQLIWPALAVGYRYSAMAARMTRSAMLEVLREDYVRTAWAKGLAGVHVLRRHALKNALLPVTAVIGLEFAFLLGGLVVTEQVFNLNGLGKLTVEAILHRDYTLTQVLILIMSFAYVLVNFALDVFFAWVDPRIRYV
ncbi:MAG: ABC transporter permease [Armatimonadetes bacterium]|nr:ABC transporter permease [Armatimonadota bacterium]